MSFKRPTILSAFDSHRELKMSMERDDMERFLIEKPLAYETHSIAPEGLREMVRWVI